MKNNLLFSLILILFVSTSQAQGFNFDKEAYAKRETVETPRGPIPDYTSLKRFTPIIYPQAIGDCVAQSFANALTVLMAKNNHMTDQNKITLMRPSPFFLFWSTKDPDDDYCKKGLDAEKVALFLLKVGAVGMIDVEYPNHYPFTSNVLCKDYYPPSYSTDLLNASKIRPSNIYRIETLSDIRVALANGMPVVIGMAVPSSFYECKSYVWTPRSTDNLADSYGHAMTIIGYDDNLYGGTFEVMNSWGEDWGINGFTRIRYKDAADWIVAGWAVEKQTNNVYRYDGEFEAKQDILAPDNEMLKIYSESRNDTLSVNPFFQRTDLEELLDLE